VATVAWTTDQVLRRLLPDRSVTEWSDATGTLNVVERPLPDAWAGHRLVPLAEGERFRLVGLTRGGDARVVGGEAVGQEGDILHLVVHRDAVGELEERLGRRP
jgi:trk system potassium uptake protein TrkA